jgi:uncharacterized protein (DUF885 family)
VTDQPGPTRRPGPARELAERFWDGLLAIEPLFATVVGDERFDDKLPDPSEEGLARRRDFYDSALADLEGLDRSALDQDERTTLAILEAASRRELDSIRYRLDRFYAVTHLFGPGNMLAEMGTLQRADTPERLDRYVARLSGLPEFLKATGDVAMDGARVGLTAPGLVVDRSIAQVERLVAVAPEDSPGMTPVPEENAADRERVAGVLRDEVWPAYTRYLETLREYRPAARDTIGLRDLPEGEAMYASQILSYTTVPLEAQPVHDVGRDQLEKIQEERRQIAERLGHPDARSAVAERTDAGKNSAESRKALIELVERQVQRSWDAAPRFFGRLPKANCEVRQVEEFREKDMPAAFYFPPSGDGSRQGIYYINTGDLPERPLHQLASITYHEANPGHHFQISIEQEFTDRPSLRRFGAILAGSAFAEGWGLYCERLADEMGLYVDDYERLGMLEAQGWRAVRLIVDTGIHSLGWDRERAIQQMVEAGPPRQAAEVEIDRYIAWPGQALSYMIGQLEIQRWRAEAERKGGAGFSLPDFHDRLLSVGALPLPALQLELGDGTVQP